MAQITSSDYGVYPPRAVHVGTNRMHTSITTSGAGQSASASDSLYFFPIPPECFAVGGSIKASAPAGTTANIIIKLGIPGQDGLFGTYTISGSAALATNFNFYSPITVSASGTSGQVPVVAIVTSVSTSTVSYSIYIQLVYTMPGNIN